MNPYGPKTIYLAVGVHNLGNSTSVSYKPNHMDLIPTKEGIICRSHRVNRIVFIPNTNIRSIEWFFGAPINFDFDPEKFNKPFEVLKAQDSGKKK